MQNLVDFWLIHLQALLANAFQLKLKSAQINRTRKKSSLFSSRFINLGEMSQKSYTILRFAGYS
ncbi:hypothetical protein [Metabacillus fastidiosus]|uniref:hypothetical protein n=1 Tax=Metabacillus fastidiosus TaxID=1458 RepID=UPI002E22A215|nr:hypothetical protein [Metabacillus fastidiosus]